ncbi:hypothetical protein [Cupriavidus plantarum]|uniref:hypothetical protein n=1 Tax=Cupriavidus plantarum TaxID=942865 RepID=UPI000F29929C|nr:hypothetical protein [Cupriavidus plantarum]RLK45975.1 hypothetical protein C7417_2006 [Cupriavidus plantarum]
MILWMLHIAGPDDVIAAPSHEEADRVAAAFNELHSTLTAKMRALAVKRGHDPLNYPTIRAVVREWDGTAEEHLECLTAHWHEYSPYPDMVSSASDKFHAEAP